MPENASGFVDFSQFADLNSEEEQRLLDEAVARAEAADATAQNQLRTTEREAMGRYGADGQISGESQSLSQTGSYSDYLKYKQNAEKAWAAVNANSKDPRSAALRGSLRDEGAAGRAQSSRDAAEAASGARVGAGASSLATQRQQAAERAAAQVKAQSGRQSADQAAKASYMTGLYSKWMDAQGNNNSPRMPYGAEDRSRYAQQLSAGVDEGFALPGRPSGSPGADVRGQGIEAAAWGTPRTPYGRGRTKKGTAY